MLSAAPEPPQVTAAAGKLGGARLRPCWGRGGGGGGEGISALLRLQPGRGVEGGTLRSPLFFLGGDGSREEGTTGSCLLSDDLGSKCVFFTWKGFLFWLAVKTTGRN